MLDRLLGFLANGAILFRLVFQAWCANPVVPIPLWYGKQGGYEIPAFPMRFQMNAQANNFDRFAVYACNAPQKPNILQ